MIMKITHTFNVLIVCFNTDIESIMKCCGFDRTVNIIHGHCTAEVASTGSMPKKLQRIWLAADTDAGGVGVNGTEWD